MSKQLDINPRTPRDVLLASGEFAKEQKLRSWWVVLSTAAVLFGLLTLAALVPWWPLKVAASLCGSLVMVRGFILFHDYKHGAIFRKSRVVGPLLNLYGLLFLTAPEYWKKTHNYHHAHVGAKEHAEVGSFPLMDTEGWKNATAMERFHYRIARSPFTLMFAYFTVFLISNTIEPFLRNPKKNWICGASLLVHAGAVVGLWMLGGFWFVFLVFWMPYFVAAAGGAYLFYVQHNFKGMKVLPDDEWSLYNASMQS
ncbi:fatty acid desaturase, partial [Planctomycetota bacterium]|nr:fatty acid desaturase [Planctomycetota bacterium]